MTYRVPTLQIFASILFAVLAALTFHTSAMAAPEFDVGQLTNEATDLHLESSDKALEKYGAYADKASRKKKKSFRDRVNFAKKVMQEGKEIISALVKGDAKEALIECAGALTNFGVSALTSKFSALKFARYCAIVGTAVGTPLIGILSAGVCFAVATKLAEAIPQKAEDLVEHLLRSTIFARRRPEVYKGSTHISVFVDGAVIARADGSGARSTNNIGVSKGGGNTITVNIDGTVTTSSANRSSSQTDIGVANGDGSNISVNVDGDVTTTAYGNSKAQTDIGVANGDNARIQVNMDGDVNTTASGRSKSNTAIGVANGNDIRIVVNADGSVTTMAVGAASASTEIGTASGNRSSSNTAINGDISTTASGSGRAETLVGTANGGNVNVNLGGDVTTTSNGFGNASTTVGTGKGGTTSVQGDVLTTNSARKSATTNIGQNGSAMVGGDVLNFGGKVSVGGNKACKYTRDNNCCLDLYMNRCVTRIVPSYKGTCPPRFIPVRGLCYFIPDWTHSFR